MNQTKYYNFSSRFIVVNVHILVTYVVRTLLLNGICSFTVGLMQVGHQGLSSAHFASQLFIGNRITTAICIHTVMCVHTLVTIVGVSFSGSITVFGIWESMKKEKILPAPFATKHFIDDIISRTTCEYIVVLVPSLVTSVGKQAPQNLIITNMCEYIMQENLRMLKFESMDLGWWRVSV